MFLPNGFVELKTVYEILKVIKCANFLLSSKRKLFGKTSLKICHYINGIGWFENPRLRIKKQLILPGPGMYAIFSNSSNDAVDASLELFDASVLS